jgi:hypothetical protein
MSVAADYRILSPYLPGPGKLDQATADYVLQMVMRLPKPWLGKPEIAEIVGMLDPSAADDLLADAKQPESSIAYLTVNRIAERSQVAITIIK